MNPNQQPVPQQFPAPQPSGQFNPGQYDFITSPPPAPKKSLIPKADSSKKQRIIFVVLAVLGLILIFTILYAVLTSGSKTNTQQLVTVLQKQQEIVRVAAIGAQKAGDAPAKNFAFLAKLSVTTQEQGINSYLKKNRIKTDKLINGGRNTKTDQQLATAQDNGRFDEAFIQVMRDSLTDYQKALKTADAAISSKTVKQLTTDDYNQVNDLLSSIGALAPSN